MVLDAAVRGSASAGAWRARRRLRPLSQFVGGVFPLIYFARNKHQPSTPDPLPSGASGTSWASTCANGSSELMSNISMSLVSMLYNVQLMQLRRRRRRCRLWRADVCQHDLSAPSSSATPWAPRLSSATTTARENQEELQEPAAEERIFIVAIADAVHVRRRGTSRRYPLSQLFVAYDEELLQMTTHAFAIFSFSFLFSGFAINGSSFFTALNDGLTSALISFLRTLVFQVAAVLLFPLLWGLDGIWFSIVAAEIMAVLATIFFLLKKQKKYGY